MPDGVHADNEAFEKVRTQHPVHALRDADVSQVEHPWVLDREMHAAHRELDGCQVLPADAAAADALRTVRSKLVKVERSCSDGVEAGVSRAAVEDKRERGEPLHANGSQNEAVGLGHVQHRERGSARMAVGTAGGRGKDHASND